MRFPLYIISCFFLTAFKIFPLFLSFFFIIIIMCLSVFLFGSILLGFLTWLPISLGRFSSVQLSRSVVSDSATPWTVACQASLSITNSWNLLKRISIDWVMPSNSLILCRSLLLLPSIFPSISVFSNESALRMSWAKYWSLSFNISTSNEHPGLISFGMDLIPKTGWISLPSKDSQVSSPTPQFKSINSLVLSFPYSSILTSIHDYWKYHSLD